MTNTIIAFCSAYLHSSCVNLHVSKLLPWTSGAYIYICTKNAINIHSFVPLAKGDTCILYITIIHFIRNIDYRKYFIEIFLFLLLNIKRIYYILRIYYIYITYYIYYMYI